MDNQPTQTLRGVVWSDVLGTSGFRQVWVGMQSTEGGVTNRVWGAVVLG